MVVTRFEEAGLAGGRETWKPGPRGVNLGVIDREKLIRCYYHLLKAQLCGGGPKFRLSGCFAAGMRGCYGRAEMFRRFGAKNIGCFKPDLGGGFRLVSPGYCFPLPYDGLFTQ